MFKISWTVMKQDRELLGLTFINAAVGLALGLIAFLILGVVGILSAIGGDDAFFVSPHLAVWIVVIAALVIGVTIATNFFGGAIVYGTNERLTGGDPTLKSAIAGARKKLGPIVKWALMGLFISWLISLLQAAVERIRFVGWILSSLIDLAWRVLSFLVLPIVVLEGRGPIESLKRSKELLSNTWGNNLVAQLGFTIIYFVLILPALIVMGLAIATGSSVLIGLAVLITGLYAVAVALVMSALNRIFQTVLYRYAITGQVPDGFTAHDLNSSFRERQPRGLNSGGMGGRFDI